MYRIRHFYLLYKITKLSDPQFLILANQIRILPEYIQLHFMLSSFQSQGGNTGASPINIRGGGLWGREGGIYGGGECLLGAHRT